ADERLLVFEREHRLQQQHHLVRAGGHRRHLLGPEGTREAMSPVAGDADGGLAPVDTDVAAPQRTGEVPSRPRDPAAEVEDARSLADPRAPAELEDLAGAHEALLSDVVAGCVCRLTGALECGRTGNQFARLTVPSDGWPRPDDCWSLCSPAWRRSHWCSQGARRPSTSEPRDGWREPRAAPL